MATTVIRRPEDAENETKTDQLLVRLGPGAKGVLEHAAKEEGVSVARYLRVAGIEKALRQGADARGTTHARR